MVTKRECPFKCAPLHIKYVRYRDINGPLPIYSHPNVKRVMPVKCNHLKGCKT